MVFIVLVYRASLIRPCCSSCTLRTPAQFTARTLLVAAHFYLLDIDFKAAYNLSASRERSVVCESHDIKTFQATSYIPYT